ncbi:MAG: sugar ABC transporter substrate-binding protein [SAR324 cluster bacterium]|nr:sugar ABC transporter substrate-binding protein [SAR324 cluster bacterium]
MYKKLIFFLIWISLVHSIHAAQTIQVWFHSGKGEERKVLNEQVKRFNQMQQEIHVNLILLPEGSYNDQVNAAALAKDLPDLLDFDGPYIANYVWSGFLRPLDKLVNKEIIEDLLPSIINQGTYPGDGRLYSIGTFDSGLALWGNKQLLKKGGVRIPTSTKDAWNLKEFEEALAKLASTPGVKWPLDLKLNYGRGEWFTYGFSPILQSMGGDLIDRKRWVPSGTLNSKASIEAMGLLQKWVKQGWVVNAASGDNKFYGDKSVGLSWVGHWMWQAHKKGLGDDLVLIPMPRFGSKAVTGMGSWNWGITKKSKHPKLAAKFLEFLLQPEEVLRMANANGAVPARLTSIDQSSLYQKGGPLHLFIEQLKTIAVPRPFHPAYPILTSVYAEAVDHILAGGNVEIELNKAVRKIVEDIEDNDGYPPFGK